MLGSQLRPGPGIECPYKAVPLGLTALFFNSRDNAIHSAEEDLSKVTEGNLSLRPTSPRLGLCFPHRPLCEHGSCLSLQAIETGFHQSRFLPPGWESCPLLPVSFSHWLWTHSQQQRLRKPQRGPRHANEAETSLSHDLPGSQDLLIRANFSIAPLYAKGYIKGTAHMTAL